MNAGSNSTHVSTPDESGCNPQHERSEEDKNSNDEVGIYLRCCALHLFLKQAIDLAEDVSGNEVIARICKVDVKTARRWKNGTNRVPETAKMVLIGDLGAFCPAFSGWTLRGGNLISPEGWLATPGDILFIPLLRAQVAAYQAKERIVNGMEEQPLPAEISAIVG